MKLDEKDLTILSQLMQDSSKTVVKLSELLGLPRATIQERIRKMRKEGVIKRFTVIPNHAQLGRPVKAFILVSFLPNPDVSQRKLAAEIALLDGVQEVDLISGEWDILLKVRGASMEQIGALVIDRLRAMKGVGSTVTCVSFATVKEEL